MATNPAVPFWDEGNTITCRGSAAITGKRFVTVTGPRLDGNPQVGHVAGSATKRAVGVSARDAAQGVPVSVFTAPGIVMPVTTSEAISAGDDLYSAADGTAVKTAPNGARPAAVALDDAASGADVPAKLL
jgi:hypothetical protein